MKRSTKPVLLDFPDHFETERLVVRAPRPGDGAAGNQAIQESVAELSPWFPWMHPVPTPEDTELHYRQAAARWLTREELPMVLIRKSDGMFVGGAGLIVRSWDVPYFEIGYWVRTSLQRQGYITEAVKGTVDFAFTVLHAQRVEIRCDARNERSAAVARRAGFTYEGRLRNYGCDVHGELYDMLYFARYPGV